MRIDEGFEKQLSIVSKKHDLLLIRVSDKMEKLRGEMVKRPLRPKPDAGDEKIGSWIDSTFSLDYDLEG